MKTPPARRKKRDTSHDCRLVKVPPHICPEPQTQKEMCPDRCGGIKGGCFNLSLPPHVCPEPQEKPHQHNQWCPECQFFAKEHPVIKYEKVPEVHFQPQPTFSIHLAWFFLSVLMFLAGAAWQFPYWLKNGGQP
jgi:hypothetical protein